MSRNLHEGHREKVKQRFIEEGLNAFEDIRCLSCCFYTIPRKDTNEMAHCLLEKFGTLESLFDSEPELVKGRLPETPLYF